MLGKQIKEIRKAHGLTQEQFGKKLSHTKSTISKWENGTLHPDIQTIKEISNTFHVDLNLLLSGVETKVKKEPSVELFRWDKVYFDGNEIIKKKSSKIIWAYTINSLVLIIGFLLLLVPMAIAKDGYGKKEVTYLLIGTFIVLITIFLYWTIFKIDSENALKERYNVFFKLYNNGISLRGKHSSKYTFIERDGIENISYDKESVITETITINILLKSGRKLNIYKVDNSVYENIKRMMKGGKNE